MLIISPNSQVQQVNNSCHIQTSQEMKNSSKQSRKSLSQTLLHVQQNDVIKRHDNLKSPGRQAYYEELDLNPLDRSSPGMKKINKNPQQNKAKIEESPQIFIDLNNNSSHFFCLEDKEELDKAQNYIYYYPYYNPEFIINSYNHFKIHRIQKYLRKSPYTISFVISDKIKQKVIIN